MPLAQLARLERVPLREGWPNEAGDFTPWLAQPENLRLLAQTIGIELECESVEKPVGSFSADILCRDTTTGAWVLIENQIERTDHNHLGQLLTYAAGLEATTIVWVAATFREEHRAALDWLNEISAEDFRFFGLEVELWRIADSPAAPKFNIISKPNAWSRDVRETAREAGELSENRVLQREYWTAFVEYLKRSGSSLPQIEPAARNSIHISLGRAGIRLNAAISSWDFELEEYGHDSIRAGITIKGKRAQVYYDELSKHRDHVDSVLLPDAVTWYAQEGVQLRRIFVRRDADVLNRADWQAQHEWLRQRLEKLEHLFRPLLVELSRSVTAVAE